MASVTITWVGATDATIASDYIIYSDKATSGTFAQVATQDATAPYTPYSTTLNGDITASATTVILTDGTNFAANDIIYIDGEAIKLGTKATHTFTGCTRGYGGRIAEAHTSGTTVYRAGESYTDNSVTWGDRNVIRYRVVHKNASLIESWPVEILVYNMPTPPATKYTVVYGILEAFGTPRAGVPVTLALADVDNYLVSGEMVYQVTQTDTTDADGFFHFFVEVGTSKRGNDNFTLTVAAGTSAARTITMSYSQVISQRYLNVTQP